MPEEYRRHLAQQRADAKTMAEINLANRKERGSKEGHEYDMETVLGKRHPADVLRDACGPRVHQCATMKRVVRSALSIGALGG
eukprot:6838321-Alexandrium_andersonii.AAC.1